MTDNDESRNLPVAKWWQPRFRLATLLIVVLAVSVLAAAAGYLIRSFANESSQDASPTGPLVFILITLAAPMLLMIAVSVGRQLVHWLNRHWSNRP